MLHALAIPVEGNALSISAFLFYTIDVECHLRKYTVSGFVMCPEVFQPVGTVRLDRCLKALSVCCARLLAELLSFCQHSVLIIVLIYPPYFSRVAPLQSLSQVEWHPERYPVWHQTAMLAFQNFFLCPLSLSFSCLYPNSRILYIFFPCESEPDHNEHLNQ